MSTLNEVIRTFSLLMADITQSEKLRLRVFPVDLTALTKFYRAEYITLYKLFQRKGYEVGIVGLAVCDAILGTQPDYVEFVTSATPDQLRTMFQPDDIPGLEVVKETNGTFTITMNKKLEGLSTTIRIKTAPVTKDWEFHAAHKEFTVNSMLLKVHPGSFPCGLGISVCFGQQPIPFRVKGYVFDYHDGVKDVRHRRIRFVGNPTARISEDPLRILKYFRIHGYLATLDQPDLHDRTTLKAIFENVHTLARVDGHCCWLELQKIMCYNSTPSLVRRMFDTGVFPHVGLHGIPAFLEMDSAWQKGILSRNPWPVTCLATIVYNEEQAVELHERLGFSTIDRKILSYIIENRKKCATLSKPEIKQHFRRELLISTEIFHGRRIVLMEMMKYLVYDVLLLFYLKGLRIPKCPVTKKDVRRTWSVKYGLAGIYLRILRQQWVDSDCTWKRCRLLSKENRAIVEDLALESSSINNGETQM
ncbi:unnamed protein product [Dicrocoelium dendriticum]|nr:unnamed protein product [Dicrocoelium dendriticum]